MRNANLISNLLPRRLLGAAVGDKGRTRQLVAQLFGREGKAKRFELATARDARASAQLAELRLN